MKKFCIKDKKSGALLGLSITGTGSAEFCNGYEASLCEFGETLFMADKREYAERVIREPAEWYNAGTTWPMLGRFKPEELEVVEVTITF